ncbi:MAG: hypothetical protein JXA69_12630 [Phycisphaerae bacterium]|nr:hypothetical protein [Phycisphaerae bacterium]
MGPDGGGIGLQAGGFVRVRTSAGNPRFPDGGPIINDRTDQTRRPRFAIAACAILLCTTPAAAVKVMTWRELPSLPPSPGQNAQPGLAGPFAGAAGGALIVGGGANFPDAPPWFGGKKAWWDDVFVLRPGALAWLTDGRFKLPRPLAYGVSITTDEGVVCIGGCDADRCYADVFLLTWNEDTKLIGIEALTSLPAPLAFAAGAKVDDVIYVAGGVETMTENRSTKRFDALDLSKRGTDEFAWESLEPWPGPARTLPVAAGQTAGAGAGFYLFSGRTAAPDTPTEHLTDAYRYVPQTGEWERLADIAPEGEPPRSVNAATALVWDDFHPILVLGGADVERFRKQEQTERQMRQATDPATLDALAAQRREVFETHPGFPRQILAFDTVAQIWLMAGMFPDMCPVTTVAVPWGDGFAITSGEIRPGVRTPKVWLGRFETVTTTGPSTARRYHAILAIGLLAILAVSLYYSRRKSRREPSA